MVSVAAGLARSIQQTGWDVVVEFDKDAPLGEFAVFLDSEMIFSRLLQGRMPETADIMPVLKARLFGAGDE